MPGFDLPDPGPPRQRSGPVVLTIELPGGDVDPRSACERLRTELADRPGGVVVCHVGSRRPCDMTTIDLVARLALAARQCGCRLLLRDPSPQMRSLLGLAGLAAVIPCADDVVD